MGKPRHLNGYNSKVLSRLHRIAFERYLDERIWKIEVFIVK